MMNSSCAVEFCDQDLSFNLAQSDTESKTLITFVDLNLLNVIILVIELLLGDQNTLNDYTQCASFWWSQLWTEVSEKTWLHLCSPYNTEVSHSSDLYESQTDLKHLQHAFVTSLVISYSH